jgi:hypothetical protein
LKIFGKNVAKTLDKNINRTDNVFDRREILEAYYSFVNILKYHDSTNLTQLENYTTELFVFVLNYLVNKNRRILIKLLKEFGFSENTDVEKLHISTQCNMDVGGNKAIPDILIEYKGKNTIIEVKVDSNLNFYSYKNRLIDQIEYYENIKNINSVFLLSKRLIKIKKNGNRILWSRIYTIINNTNDFVLNNFAKYLEENGMGNYKLTKNIFNAVSSIENLYALLKEAWIYDEYDYTFSPMEFSKKGWVSCYISNQKKKHLFWIGQLGGDECLCAELMDNDIKKQLKNYEFLEGWKFDTLNLKEIINLRTFEDQKVSVNNWYRKMMKKLTKYIKAKHVA